MWKNKTNGRLDMNTREIEAEYRLSHWAQVMRQRIESGLNIKAFCENAGFHENIYHYWQLLATEIAGIGLRAGSRVSGRSHTYKTDHICFVYDLVRRRT